MKQKSFHILFFVKKNKIKANGEAPIAFRITVDWKILLKLTQFDQFKMTPSAEGNCPPLTEVK